MVYSFDSDPLHEMSDCPAMVPCMRLGCCRDSIDVIGNHTPIRFRTYGPNECLRLIPTRPSLLLPLSHNDEAAYKLSIAIVAMSPTRQSAASHHQTMPGAVGVAERESTTMLFLYTSESKRLGRWHRCSFDKRRTILLPDESRHGGYARPDPRLTISIHC